MIRPEEATLEDLPLDSDLEVLHATIELLGHERFLEAAKAQLVQEDDFGRLHRIRFFDYEPLTNGRSGQCDARPGRERAASPSESATGNRISPRSSRMELRPPREGLCSCSADLNPTAVNVSFYSCSKDSLAYE